MFNFQDWIEIFQTHYYETGVAYNDAIDYNVAVQASNSNWKVIGIHHLLPYENKAPHEREGKRNVFIELLCKQNEREAFKAIHWTWKDRHPNEAVPDVFAGQKPPNELVDIPLNLGMIVSVWPHLGEKVIGLSSNHPDEAPGNTIGHHSFFVCFQEIDGDIVLPDPDPPPNPNPVQSIIRVTANLDWLNTLPIDDKGNVNFELT